MQKIVEINSVVYGSTGKIMNSISELANKNGFEVYRFVGHSQGLNKEDKNIERIGNKFSFLFSLIFAGLGFDGHSAYFATKKLIKKIKKISPDIIHLHNVHGYYLNYKLLFNYLKKEYKGKVIWTLHDCWSFTGHCAHFTYVNCEKWKTCCGHCAQIKCYPKEYFDTTKREYKLKKKIFTGIPNLTIITPSIWLFELVKKSFLKEYPIEVINNGIDLNIFKPYDMKELQAIYIKYKIPTDKKIVLGVANAWGEKKGLNDFIKISQIIEKEYKVVLVGTNGEIDRLLPTDIISIHRTDNQIDLAKIYALSDIFINPTYEDNFPTTNIEAIACGTPTISYDTGGCKEVINENCGKILKSKSYKELLDEIYELSNFKKSDKNKSVEISANYNMNDKFEEYINLFKKGRK